MGIQVTSFYLKLQFVFYDVPNLAQHSVNKEERLNVTDPSCPRLCSVFRRHNYQDE